MASHPFKAFALFLILTSPASAGWFSYDNYDDCMLGKMKGQNTSVLSSAVKECKRQFKVEFSLYTPAIKWSLNRVPGGSKIILHDEDEYIVTSGDFEFSEQPCAQSKPEDFKPATLRFDNGVGLNVSFGNDVCAKAVSFRGRYK